MSKTSADLHQSAPSPQVAKALPVEAKATATPGGAEVNRKEARRLEAQARKEQAVQRRPLQKEVELTEARLGEISERKSQLEECLADPSTYQDVERAKELNQEFSALTTEGAEVEKRWELAMAGLENL